MSSVTCEYCGENYPITERKCPLCGADNEHYTDSSEPSEDCADAMVECPLCGYKHESGLSECPLCGYKYESSTPDVEDVADTEDYDSYESQAVLIDEESDYVPLKKRVDTSKKQDAPDTKLVLGAFVGILLIIIVAVVKMITGVADKASDRIGAEMFQQQTSQYQHSEW